MYNIQEDKIFKPKKLYLCCANCAATNTKARANAVAMKTRMQVAYATRADILMMARANAGAGKNNPVSIFQFPQ